MIGNAFTPASTNKLGFKPTGYLKAIWPDFWGCIFEVWLAPGARESLQKYGAKTPTFCKAFPGPRGRPDLKHASKKSSQTAFRYPDRGFSLWLTYVFGAAPSHVPWGNTPMGRLDALHRPAVLEAKKLIKPYYGTEPARNPDLLWKMAIRTIPRIPGAEGGPRTL